MSKTWDDNIICDYIYYNLCITEDNLHYCCPIDDIIKHGDIIIGTFIYIKDCNDHEITSYYYALEHGMKQLCGTTDNHSHDTGTGTIIISI